MFFVVPVFFFFPSPPGRLCPAARCYQLAPTSKALGWHLEPGRDHREDDSSPPSPLFLGGFSSVRARMPVHDARGLSSGTWYS